MFLSLRLCQAKDVNKSHMDLSYECHLSFNIKFTTYPSPFEKLLRNFVYVGAALSF